MWGICQKQLGIGKKEFDLYNETFNLAIEYDGQMFHQDVAKDTEKDNLANSLGISLYRIREPRCPLYQSSANQYLVKNPYKEVSLIATLKLVWDNIASKHYPSLVGCYPHVNVAEVWQRFNTSQTVTQKHLGETIVNNSGRKMKIIAWHNNRNLDISVEGYPYLITKFS